MIDKGINVKKIDLSGVSFPTSDASTCALIYTAVRNTYGFPLYLTNFKINDEKRDSILVNPIIIENQTIINLNDCHLIVTPTEISVGRGVYGASLESIVDKDGNPRFVEGDITMETIEGITQTYGKWSLSGTHLMLVLAGTIANNTILSGTPKFATISLSSYILNKVQILWGNIYVERKSIVMIADDWSTQTFDAGLSKRTNSLEILKVSGSAITVNADRNFRIQFDLLIDTD